jgi:signal transduction histidine kinase
VRDTSSRPDDPDSRSGDRPGIRRGWLDLACAILSLLNLAAIVVWPSWDTVPFHLISIGFAALYGLRIWPVDPMVWGLGVVIIATFTGICLDVLHVDETVEEVAEIPLMAAMFVAIVWHANRRVTADHERRLIGEKNVRLLSAQRRFLQDASHHLRTPVTIALTHAELLARDLAGRDELRDVQVIVAEMDGLRRLSERLLVIAAAEDQDFLNPELVALDGFALEVVRRWRPTAQRRWQLGRLDAATVRADPERLGLAVDALLENAIRHTPVDGVIQLSVIRGEGGNIRMIISDTGSGIPADELPRVFDRFRTGSRVNGIRGTGLGLALVRAVAQAHGGDVHVRSAPGEGSEFELVLPAVTGEEPPVAAYREWPSVGEPRPKDPGRQGAHRHR